jgi:hypothetical protein
MRSTTRLWCRQGLAYQRHFVTDALSFAQGNNLIGALNIRSDTHSLHRKEYGKRQRLVFSIVVVGYILSER